MARVSEPNALRTGISHFWEFFDFKEINTCGFLLKYWLYLSFRKMFEKKREKITLFTNINIAIYYIFIYVTLAVSLNKFFLKKRQKLKKRILFFLFKKKKIRRKYRPKFIKYSQYLKTVQYSLQGKGRFIAYCDLVCYKFQTNFLANLLKTKPMLNLKKTNYFDIPFKLTVKNFFSIIDRKYVSFWKYFNNLVKKHLWFIGKDRYFDSTLKVCFLFIFSPNAQLLVDHIAYLFKNSRKHWQIINTINHLYKLFAYCFPVFNALKIRIKGCIQDSERTKYINIGKNFVVTQTFNKIINFAIAHSATPFGALGIKLWVLF